MAVERSGGRSSSPAEGGYAITKHDTNVLEPPIRAIWVGGTGNIKVRMFDGSEVTIEDIPAGTLLPIRIDKVFSTDTTATKLVGLY